MLLSLGVTRVLLVIGVSTATVGLPLTTAILLGLIEGITEYLPVSSTGHLAVAARLMGSDITPERQAALDSYVIVIQAGAIVAVLGLYADKVRAMISGAIGRDPVGRRMLLTLIIGFVPAGLAGLLLGSLAQEYLFALAPIAAAWIVGGVAILVIERVATDTSGDAVEDVTPRQGLVIGAAQIAALWPGTSRSLVTILAGRAAGLSKVAAVEFSFLLGVMLLGAATIYEGARSGGDIISELGLAPVVVGFVTAAVSAAVAVRWLVTYVSRHTLAIFGWYRIAIGVATLIWLAVS